MSGRELASPESHGSGTEGNSLPKKTAMLWPGKEMKVVGEKTMSAMIVFLFQGTKSVPEEPVILELQNEELIAAISQGRVRSLLNIYTYWPRTLSHKPT